MDTTLIRSVYTVDCPCMSDILDTSIRSHVGVHGGRMVCGIAEGNSTSDMYKYQ